MGLAAHVTPHIPSGEKEGGGGGGCICDFRAYILHTIKYGKHFFKQNYKLDNFVHHTKINLLPLNLCVCAFNADQKD